MTHEPAPPITGGTPDRTGRLAAAAWMMKTMQGAGTDPLTEKLEKQQGKQPRQGGSAGLPCSSWLAVSAFVSAAARLVNLPAPV